MRSRYLWVAFLILSLVGIIVAFVLVTSSEKKPQEKVITIIARRFYYSPAVIEVNKGDRVRIKLISRDVYHGFYIDGYNLEANVKRGERSKLSFIADKSGRFSFRCSKTCGDFHPYMIGYFRVMPNTRFYVGVLGVLVVGLLFASGTWFARKKHNQGNPGVPERLLGIIPLNWRFELTKFKVVRKALKSRWFPFLAIVFCLFIFTLVFLAGIVGSPAGNYNFSTMIVWIFWWVLLIIILVPFFGRLWCAICPLPAPGEWLHRFGFMQVRKKLFGLNRKWPRFLSNMWLLNFIFLTLIFFAGFFTVRPMSTFFLLMLIILAALVISLIYQRRNFCLYLCPVSGFQGLYSNFSPSEIRPKNHEICRNHKPKTCYTGNEKGYGCPWQCVPSNLERNTYCGMCFECFKTCPYDNMAWNIRPPGVDLLPKARRRLDEAWMIFILLSVAIVLYITTQGPWGFLKTWARAGTLPGYFIYLGGLTIFTIVLMPLIFFAFAYLSKRLSTFTKVPLKQVFVNYSYALIPIGLTAWIAFGFGKIFPNGSYLINVISDPFAWGWNIFRTAGFKWHPFLTGLMPNLQIFILLIGLIFALEYGYKITQQTYSGEKEGKRAWIPMFLFFLGMTVFLIWIFVW